MAASREFGPQPLAFLIYSMRAERNIKFAYPIGQGRPLHAEACGRTVRTPEHPVGSSDRAHHMFTFHFFQRTQLGSDSLDISPLQLCHGCAEDASRREYHRPLNEILQLAHIARP